MNHYLYVSPATPKKMCTCSSRPKKRIGRSSSFQGNPLIEYFHPPFFWILSYRSHLGFSFAIGCTVLAVEVHGEGVGNGECLALTLMNFLGRQPFVSEPSFFRDNQANCRGLILVSCVGFSDASMAPLAAKSINFPGPAPKSTNFPGPAAESINQLWHWQILGHEVPRGSCGTLSDFHFSVPWPWDIPPA